MNTSFSTKEIFSLAWKKTKEHLGFLVLLTLAFLIVNLILGKIGSNVLISLVSIALSFFSMFTFVRMGLKLIKGESFAFKDVFEIDWKMFGLYILGSILFTIAYAVGFILLIIPGIIVAVRLGFFGFIMIEERSNPVPSLKKSLAMTKDHFWKLFGFALILCLINIAGAIPFGIGMLFTAPFSIIATAYMYERIKSLPRATVAEPVQVL